MKTVNKHVAIAPFKTNHTVSDRNARGLDMSDLTVSSLISSKVLFSSENYTAGVTLFFRSDIMKLPQVKTKLKVQDVEFILIPEDLIVGYETP